MKTLLLLLLTITISLAQSPFTHYRQVTWTNMAVEPCVTYHFYGIGHSGGVTSLGACADHDPLLNQFENGQFEGRFRFVLRSEGPARLLIVSQNTEPPKPVARFPPDAVPFIPEPPSLPIFQTNHITKN